MPPVPVSQITAKYKQALALQSKGQNESALAIYSQILEAKPDIAEVHFQVGRIFFAGNKFEKSVFHFDIALQLKPNEPAIWDQYISSLLCNADPEPIKNAAKRLKKTTMGKHVVIALQNKLLNTANGSIVPIGNLNKSALSAVQSAILAQDYVQANALATTLFQQNPKNAVVAELLARTYINLNQLDDARKYFKIATTLDPMFFNAFNNFGHAELEAKNYAVAAALFRSAVIAAPHAVSGLNNLADAMYFNGQVSDAQALIKNAKKLHLKGGKLDLLLAEMFVRTGYYEDAQKSYRIGIKREKPSARLYFEIGDIFNAAEQLRIALEYYDLALTLDSDNPEIIFHQAVAYRELGEFDATLERISYAIKLAPDNPHFLAFYANSKKVDANDPAIEQMIKMHSEKNTADEARISLGFAISKSLEDSKQYDRVFSFLKSANDDMHALFPYDVKTAERETDEFIEYFQNFKLADFAGMGHSEAHPIFVCGMPRSGTTLVEQIISSHSEVIGAGEVGYTNSAIAREIQVDSENVIPLAQINSGQLEKIGADIWKFLTHRYPGSSHITDKSIMTYKRMGLLKAAMPNCKFIVVRRDPKDNLLSIYRNRFKDNTHLYAYDLADLGASYKQFVRTIDFWRAQMPEGFMEIQYEDLIDDPEKHARALINYCDLEWQDDCLNFHKSKRQVKTLSVMQVRQPIYKSSVKAWQRYEEDLKPLFEALK
jgi:tetratricopeptide (TPR) repeat protein